MMISPLSIYTGATAEVGVAANVGWQAGGVAGRQLARRRGGFTSKFRKLLGVFADFCAQLAHSCTRGPPGLARAFGLFRCT